MKYRVFRIRMIGDHRDWLAIEDIVFECDDQEFAAVIRFLRSIPDVYEIRWNYPGSLQGHYILGGWQGIEVPKTSSKSFGITKVEGEASDGV